MALSSTDCKLLETVDKRTKYLVHGFIREVSKNIPLPIIEICVLFYFVREYFTAYGGLLIEGDEKDIIKSVEEKWENIAYGSIWFESTSTNIIKWTLKMVHNHTNDNGYCIGITSEEDTTGKQILWQKMNYVSYILCNGRIYKDGQATSRRYLTRNDFGKKGSSITMELNLKKGQLMFRNKDKDFGIAADIQRDESIRYKIAICLYHNPACLKLVNFESNS